MNVLHRGDSVCIGPEQFIMCRLHIGEDVYKTYGWILILLLVLFRCPSTVCNRRNKSIISSIFIMYQNPSWPGSSQVEVSDRWQKQSS